MNKGWDLSSVCNISGVNSTQTEVRYSSALYNTKCLVKLLSRYL